VRCSQLINNSLNQVGLLGWESGNGGMGWVGDRVDCSVEASERIEKSRDTAVPCPYCRVPTPWGFASS